jgi:C4-dicarboxylate-specific signal transduction histidine kinase
MRPDAEDLARTDQLKFIGKVLSVYAHDLNNQLGIIKEASGLMLDIVELNKSKDKQLKETLAGPMRTIHNQLGNAAHMTSKLSAFGRGIAMDGQPLNINEIVGELLVLLKRMAAQRRVALVADLEEDIPNVSADPLMIRFLIFCIMEDQLLRLKAKGRLVFKTRRSGSVLSLVVHSEGDQEQSDEKRSFPEETVQLIAQVCGVNIVVKGSESSIIFKL